MRAVIPALITGSVFAGCSSQGAMAPLSSAAPAQPGLAQISRGVTPLQARGDLDPMLDNQNFMPQTWEGIHAFQTFDGYVPYKDAKAHGTRYDLVWGASNPKDWSMGNPAILNTFYLPMTTDGDLKNTLAWWQAFHPDWILYHCDKVTPAWSQGLPQVPLDISNPDAVAWQIQTYGGKAEAQGYAGIAADLVGFSNGNSGCGVWSKGVWIQKFSGQKSGDAAWIQAVENWASYAHTYLHGLSRPLILAANHVPTNSAPGDPNETALQANLDIDEDEAGFSGYGNGPASDTKFNAEVYWMRYAQSIGHAFFVIDKWKTPAVTQSELDWSIATYLMGKRHGASLDVVDVRGYGYEYWFPQYTAAIGHPCRKMYFDQGVYFRQYSRGLSIVNTKAGAPITVNLPLTSYTSIDGANVQSPLQVAPMSGTVLLQTTPGC